MIDEPQALPETHGFITSGWTQFRPAAMSFPGSRRFWASNTVRSAAVRPLILATSKTTQ